MGYLIRGITKNKNARFFCVDSKNIVEEAQKIHKCSATTIAAFGRVLTAGVIMGSDLKGEKDLLTIKITGDGALKQIIVTANSKGYVKGYVSNPYADLPLNENGKLDVGGIIGRGNLQIIKDMGLKEPYVGISNLVSGEIGEDLANYFFYSEQVPSVVGVGVLVDKDLSIKRAGGFIIQLLPEADEEFINRLEEKIKTIKSVTEMLESNMSPEDIINSIFENVEDIEILDKKEVKYNCDCDKDRFYRGLITLDKNEIKEMLETDKEIKAKCHFCHKEYIFTEEDFKEFLEN
ncbi:Hsp33 family molecular chaperone HslO [Haliovirga abyssi]|uniref:33 kDa chaperonin n=1 Tax=Haliovirga abyssi TaxID=2996794 RepID=A0AAU9D2G1_9FUSO|nr:Hsp33 family molecular chaperone HslO [Haliovirga abyssi]BDU50179.1 33 kDa chaperonin [Haliovirga abyssi]